MNCGHVVLLWTSWQSFSFHFPISSAILMELIKTSNSLIDLVKSHVRMLNRIPTKHGRAQNQIIVRNHQCLQRVIRLNDKCAEREWIEFENIFTHSKAAVSVYWETRVNGVSIDFPSEQRFLINLNRFDILISDFSGILFERFSTPEVVSNASEIEWNA